MPPFLRERLEAVSEHHFAQEHARGVLLLAWFLIVGVTPFAKVVKGSAHVYFLFSLHVKEGQVDGAAPAVPGMLGNVPLGEEHGLI